MHNVPDLCERVRACFGAEFGVEPEWIAHAPGRVNLLGEHVDYNGGVVLPMGIGRSTCVAVGLNLRQPTTHCFYSDSLQRRAEYRSDEGMSDGERPWWSHLAGVIDQFEKIVNQASISGRSKQQTRLVPGLDVAIASDLPIGSGLSSSAALMVAFARVLDAHFQTRLDGNAIAEICRAAEHNFAGVPCGIMDPLCIASCTAGNCLRLDCRTGSVEMIPFNARDVVILIADTRIHRQLQAQGYAIRRQECEAAARALFVQSLADVSTIQLEEFEETIDERLFRRAQHVVREVDRVRRAETALRDEDWPEFGRLMTECHESLRDLFEVSCPELDAMVEIANSLEGVYGSRLTGGGFGGCTIHLVDRRRSATIATKLAMAYARQMGLRPEIFLATPSDGAGLVYCCRTSGGAPKSKA